jgi:chromosome partitioning protein
VLATPIREAVALAESPGFGQTIFEYDGLGKGAEDYRSLADDLRYGRTLQ